MIIGDHREQGDLELRGEAVWQYIVDTLDPVIKNTLISDDNYFYLLCLQGHYTQRQVDLQAADAHSNPANEVGRCHPQYLSAGAHRKFSQPGAFDGLRIHTDELQEVIARFLPGSLSHAIVSDLPADSNDSGPIEY